MLASFILSTCMVAWLDVACGQVSVIPLVQGRITPVGTGFNFVGSVTLVRDGATNIVIDTPSGPNFAGTITMLSGLVQNGLNPTQIQMLVITHGHPDHFGHDSLFSSARHYFSSFSHVDTSFTSVSYQNRFAQLTTNVQMMQTPGHTSQDVSVIVKNVPQRGTVAIVGDLIYDAADALNPATSQVGFAFDISKLKSSRSLVICSSDYIVPGHGAMFLVTAQMRSIAQCAGNGIPSPANCATNLNQILVNGQCYNLLAPNAYGCQVNQQCVGGSTCIASVCTCPAGTMAVNNICASSTGADYVTNCPTNQVLVGNRCFALTPNQPCLNIVCLSGGEAQCRASYAPYSRCAYHRTLNNYYCCAP